MAGEEVNTLVNAIHLLATLAATKDQEQSASIQMLANYLAQSVETFANGTTRMLNVEAWAITQGYDPNTNYIG